MSLGIPVARTIDRTRCGDGRGGSMNCGPEAADLAARQHQEREERIRALARRIRGEETELTEEKTTHTPGDEKPCPWCGTKFDGPYKLGAHKRHCAMRPVGATAKPGKARGPKSASPANAGASTPLSAYTIDDLRAELARRLRASISEAEAALAVLGEDK